MFKKIIYGISGIFLAIILVEILLQITALIFPETDIYIQGPNPLRFMTYDSAVFWKIKPSVDVKIKLVDGDVINVKTINLGLNNIGFRDDGINESVYAIVLGDSFTFGAVNLTDAWIEKLEMKSGKDFINMGVSGYSTIQSEKLMEKYGMKLNPKLVLVQFYFNDIEGNYLLQSKSRAIRNWLLWNTKTYSIIRYYKYKIFDSITAGINYTDAKFNFTFQSELFPYTKTIESAQVQQGIPKTEKSLLNIKNLSNSIGAKMVIVIAPSKEQIYGYLISDKIPNFSEIHTDFYTDVIEQFCLKNELICLNLVPTFREQGKNTQLFYSIDSHFNIYGNELAAEKIYEFLQNEGLLN